MDEKGTAADSADLLLAKILETQPNLVPPQNASANSGRNVGEFLQALREGLIQMYTKTPRG